jgi:hypothetical protein
LASKVFKALLVLRVFDTVEFVKQASVLGDLYYLLNEDAEGKTQLLLVWSIGWICRGRGQWVVYQNLSV